MAQDLDTVLQVVPKVWLKSGQDVEPMRGEAWYHP